MYLHYSISGVIYVSREATSRDYLVCADQSTFPYLLIVLINITPAKEYRLR